MTEFINSIIERAAKALENIRCDYAEIRLSSGQGTTIVISGDKAESVSSGETAGGSVRVLANGAWGFVSFNDIGAIESFIRKGCETAAEIVPAVKSGIVSSRPVLMNIATESARDVRNVTFDEKYSLINSYNSILKSSPAIQTTRAMYRDFISRNVFLNTEGSKITYDRSYCGISLSSVAKDGNIIQPFHDSISGYGGFEIAENREDMAERIVRTATDLLKAESPQGGVYDVIINQKLAGVFIHEAFGHLSEADFVHENEQMKKIMVLGKVFGPEDLSVIDEGGIPGLAGYIPFDDEGIIPGKTCLIRNGMLSGRLHSRETALRMNEPLTGNARAISAMRQPIVRMTNTYIENSAHSPEEMMDKIGNGIYAADVIGGETNLEMFTFSAAYGHEIKNGRRGRLLKDIVLSGNVFTTLKNIAMLGNDRLMFGGLGGCGKEGQSPLPVSFGGPHVLIKKVLIGGAQ